MPERDSIATSRRSAEPERPLAIICGGGAFAAAVADAVQRRGGKAVLFAIRGFADREVVERYPHEWVFLGAIGRLRRLLIAHGCRDLCFVGTLHRPRLRDIRLDWATIRLLPRYLRVAQSGDNRLLATVARITEELGGRVVGAHEAAPELLVPAGVLGVHRPSADELAQIARGRDAIRALGPLDVGQAAVIAEGRVVAIEAAEGTAAMLERVAGLRRSGRLHAATHSGVLVKAPKPGQDRRVDLPAIGTETVAQALTAGLAGIAVEAGGTITTDPNTLIRTADEAGLFLFGFEPEAGARR